MSNSKSGSVCKGGYHFEHYQQQEQERKITLKKHAPPTSSFGSNISFNNKHSLGTPIVSTVGKVAMGTWRPEPPSPVRAGTRGVIGHTAGAAPRIGTVGKVRPVLLTIGVPAEPSTLQKKGRKCKKKRSISIYHNKLGREKPRSRATAVQLLHEKCSRSCIQRLRIKRRIVSAWPIIYIREINTIYVNMR